MLGVLGASHIHQKSFVLFLATVLGLSVIALVVFVLTAARDDG